MTVIVVANPKGGVGKSTLSTNLAGYFAARRVGGARRPRQAAVSRGLARIAADRLAGYRNLESQPRHARRPPKGPGARDDRHPAGLHGTRRISRWSSPTR